VAKLLLTDSGGIQEEAVVLGVPRLTMRENTEKQVTVSETTNTLAGLGKGQVINIVDRILKGYHKSGKIPRQWGGNAAGRTFKVIDKWFMGMS
jgi:UDP-N-acetylglucosamine 2-epimerase (non-hydrolysing)